MKDINIMKAENLHSITDRLSIRMVACMALALGLSACGTSQVSKNISDQGKAEEVVFPEPATAWQSEGSYPGLENLRKVQAGVSKEQLYALLSYPHFAEGMGKVREWDYIFHLPAGQADKFQTCQYKIIFDKEQVAQNMFWAPQDCAKLVAAPAPVVVERVVERQVMVPAPVAKPRIVDLAADALFAFGRSGVADLQRAGREQLDRLAAELRGAQIERLQVTGYADRLGSPAHNLRLSKVRAATVLAYLRERGVQARNAQALGRGEAEPKVACAQKERAALVACLAPNRRVSVAVMASSQP